MTTRSVIALTAIIAFATAHALLDLGRDIYHRVIDEDLGPLGPR